MGPKKVLPIKKFHEVAKDEPKWAKEKIEIPKPITVRNKTQLKADVLERQTQTPRHTQRTR